MNGSRCKWNQLLANVLMCAASKETVIADRSIRDLFCIVRCCWEYQMLVTFSIVIFRPVKWFVVCVILFCFVSVNINYYLCFDWKSKQKLTMRSEHSWMVGAFTVYAVVVFLMHTCRFARKSPQNQSMLMSLDELKWIKIWLECVAVWWLRTYRVWDDVFISSSVPCNTNLTSKA